MTGLVIDASAAVEYLLKTPLGLSVARDIEGHLLTAPELLDAEVLSVLRRLVLRGQIEEKRAGLAVDVLGRWPVQRITHRPLAQVAWEYIRNVSAYDALYVAAARIQGLPLLTADGRLSRAPKLGIEVQNAQIG